MLADILHEYGAKEVSPIEVYKYIFKLGEGYIQTDGEEGGHYKANPIAYWKNDDAEHGHFRVMFEDTFEDTLKELQKADFAIMNGITYYGRKTDMNKSSKLYCLIIDLDDVNDDNLNNFFSGASADWYPIPNYMITSGGGVHLYYVFDEPIPLFPNIKLQLKNFKYALIRNVWNRHTSSSKKSQPDYQGIYQGFRVIGGKIKKKYGEGYTRAYLIHQYPFSLQELNKFVPKEVKIDDTKLFKESKLTLKDAMRKYPNWYSKVILQKDKSRKKWDIQEKVHGDNPFALYDWWLRKITDEENGASYGHRYFAIMCLVIYAVKCDVPYEKVKKDAYKLVPKFNRINPKEPFTKKDVDSALECYDDRYFTFPLRDISKISAIDIMPNKRNGRKQKVHLAGARAIQKINDDANGTNWREGNGRPSKEQLVKDWRELHPAGTKAECHRDTKLSRDTIRKWWEEPKKEKEVKPMTEPMKVDYIYKADDGTEFLIEVEDKDEMQKNQANRLSAYAKYMQKLREKVNENNKTDS